MPDKEFDKMMLEILNDKGTNAEAMNEFRRYHGFINAFVCDDCGAVSPGYGSGGCVSCGKYNVSVKIVKDKTTPAPAAKSVEEAEAFLRERVPFAHATKTPVTLKKAGGIITSLIAEIREQGEQLEKMEFNSGCLYCMDNQDLIQELKEE